MRWIILTALVFLTGCDAERLARQARDWARANVFKKRAALQVYSSLGIVRQANTTVAEVEPPAKHEPKRERRVYQQRPALLIDEAQNRFLLDNFWPKTEDGALDAFKSRAVFYTDQTTPPIYQVWDKGRQSGARLVNGGQRTANLEFPWRTTAGLDGCPNAKVIRVAAIERGGILWWRQFLSNGAFDGIRWEYAPGTVFGEILLVTDERGEDHTFEMRTRKKTKAGTWVVDAWRPYATEEELREALKKRGYDYPVINSQGFTKQSINVRESDKVPVTGLVSFAANFTPTPFMEPNLVRDLLNVEFKSAKGQRWRDMPPGLAEDFAPYTANDFGLTAKNYEGPFVKVSQNSCMRCHEDAGKVVVEPGDERWRIRGDDAILSFHFFSPEGLARGVLEADPRLAAAGLIDHKPGMP